MPDASAVARDQLRAFIERIERLEEEKKTIADDIKDVKAEAKGCGFDVGTINAIIKLRKVDANERAERDALLDTYLIALGMLPEPADYDKPRQSSPVKREPAMVLRSDSGLNILTKHEDIRTAPETATEFQAKASDDNGATVQDIEDTAESVTGDASRSSRGDDSPATISKSDDGAIAAVNGKAGLANADGVEPPSSVQVETPSDEREEAGNVADGSRAAANAGGDDVNRSATRAGLADPTSNTGEGAACALPAKSSIRPLCRNPGETCGGYGRKHCRACEMAAAELEAAE